MNIKIPTPMEFASYNGAHCHEIWIQVGDDWRCPCCKRSKFELLRWTKRFPGKPNAFMDWMAGLHRHHDHSAITRFKQTTICDQCNSAEGAAKRMLKLPADFSFSPSEISEFVVAKPHRRHEILYEKAKRIYESLNRVGHGRSPLFWK